MEYLKSCYFIALLYKLVIALSDFARGGLIYRFGLWCWASFKNGFIYRFCVSRDEDCDVFRESILYNILTRTLNLPFLIAQGIYDRAQLLQSSAVVTYLLPRFAFLTPLSVGGLMLLMLIIPQNAWNNVYSLIGVVAILLLMVVASVHDRRFSLGIAEIGAFAILFAVAVFLSFLTSHDHGQSLRFLIFGITCMIYVLVTVGSVRTTADLSHIVALVSVGVFVCSAYALLQAIAGVETDGILTDMTLNADMPGRVYSFFENPNSFANILVLFAPLMLTMALYSRRGIGTLWYFGVFCLSSLALIMTYSRGGWLSLAVSLAVLVLIYAPRHVPLAILACVCAVPLLPDSILNRLLTIFSGGDSSIYTRVYIYSAMRGIIEQFPIFGAGLGAATLKHMVVSTGVYEATAVFSHGHNIFLQIWGEMGLVGFVTFLGTCAYAIRAGIQTKNCGNPVITAVAVGTASALCGSLFFGITDYAWSYPRVMVMFWFALALIPAAVSLKNKNTKVGNING